MGKSIQLKNTNNEKIYPHPYYPVGAIYLSVDDTNPTKWFGGTWSLIAQGRTLVGVDTNDTDFNTVKKTGGSKSVSYTPSGSVGGHILTVNEIPPHSHTIEGAIDGSGAGAHDKLALNGWSDSRWYGTMFNCWNTGGGQPHNHGFTGKASNINKVQPYFTCYIWCRTA